MEINDGHKQRHGALSRFGTLVELCIEAELDGLSEMGFDGLTVYKVWQVKTLVSWLVIQSDLLIPKRWKSPTPFISGHLNSPFTFPKKG